MYPDGHETRGPITGVTERAAEHGQVQVLYMQLHMLRWAGFRRHRVQVWTGASSSGCCCGHLLTALRTRYGFRTGGGTDAISSRTDSGSVWSVPPPASVLRRRNDLQVGPGVAVRSLK